MTNAQKQTPSLFSVIKKYILYSIAKYKYTRQYSKVLKVLDYISRLPPSDAKLAITKLKWKLGNPTSPDGTYNIFCVLTLLALEKMEITIRLHEEYTALLKQQLHEKDIEYNTLYKIEAPTPA